MITIKDIAKMAEVSVTTVSRVINNKPDVSKNTKNRVLKIIDKTGYKPNKVARGLVLSKTYTIGLVIPDISNPFFPEVSRGVENKAKSLGYSVILCDTDNDIKEEKRAIELLLSQKVDGIILSFSIDNRETLLELEKKNIPIIQIDREIIDSKFSSVTINNIKSAYKATEHLIKNGHKKLGHLNGNLATKTGQDRLKGFKEAIRKYKIELNENWIMNGNYSRSSGYELTKKLLKKKKRPTAIFAANDYMAIGAYEAVFETDFNIPNDISIIGHDNIEISSVVKPGLTTMDQPKYDLGQKAAEILIKKIENENDFGKENIVLETNLILRNSIKKI